MRRIADLSKSSHFEEWNWISRDRRFIPIGKNGCFVTSAQMTQKIVALDQYDFIRSLLVLKKLSPLCRVSARIYQAKQKKRGFSKKIILFNMISKNHFEVQKLYDICSMLHSFFSRRKLEPTLSRGYFHVDYVFRVLYESPLFQSQYDMTMWPNSIKTSFQLASYAKPISNFFKNMAKNET